MAKNVNANHNPYRPNGWAVLRDVLLGSINKGQLPLALFGMILIILVSKLPAAEVSNLCHEIIKSLETYHILGWVISFLTTFGWYFNTRKIKKIHDREMNRVSAEKTKIQETKIGKPLQSTKK
jgi:hypothetical protein